MLGELVGVVDPASRSSLEERVVGAGEDARRSANDARVAIGIEQNAELLRTEDDRTPSVGIGRSAPLPLPIGAHFSALRGDERLLARLESLVERREEDGP